MKDYSPNNIINISLVGHFGAGKTILSDAILYNAKKIKSIGSIDKGSSTSDYLKREVDHQHSISTSLLSYEFLDKKINLLDSPGMFDFQGEMMGSMFAADIIGFVVSAINGIEVGTNLAYDHLKTLGDKPKFIVINKVDSDQSDFNKSLEMLKEKFGRQVFPLMIPVNEGSSFNEISDVLKKKTLSFKTDGSGDYSETDLKNDNVASLNEEFIELIAESDEALLEKFFEDGELSDDDIRSSLSAAVANGSVIPVFCCSSTLNIGVKRINEYISKYMPNALTVNGKCDSNADLQTFVFKTINEEHVGELSFFKVFSGSLKSGDDVKNINLSTNEKIRQIYLLTGKNRVEVDKVPAGDIGVTLKLKDTHTGNTLCTGSSKAIDGFKYPTPILNMAVEPKTRGDEDKISLGLSSMHQYDPTFIYKFDTELKQTIVSGYGDMHLKLAFEKIKGQFGVDVNLLKPKIPYRETITSNSEAKYRHKKQSGGAGQFAEVWLRINPTERGSGIDFGQSLTGQNVDRGFVPSVEKGIKKLCENGIIAGCNVVDVQIDFYDGKMHPVDSNDMAFQIAGSKAFIDAFKNATPKLLEPIYKIQVKVPDELTGDVMGDISQRRGKVLDMNSEGHTQFINAEVPLANLHDYSTAIKSMTSGKGMFSVEFSHYEDMPHMEQQKVISDYQSKNETE